MYDEVVKSPSIGALMTSYEVIMHNPDEAGQPPCFRV